MAAKIKKGDRVVLLAGKDKGQRIAVNPMTCIRPCPRTTIRRPKLGTVAANHQSVRMYSSLAKYASRRRGI